MRKSTICYEVSFSMVLRIQWKNGFHQSEQPMISLQNFRSVYMFGLLSCKSYDFRFFLINYAVAPEWHSAVDIFSAKDRGQRDTLRFACHCGNFKHAE